MFENVLTSVIAERWAVRFRKTLMKNQQHRSFNKKINYGSKEFLNSMYKLKMKWDILCCQDFCHGQVMWPPLSALQVKMAEPGQSCKQVCQEEQLICEPSFFQHLNKDKDLARYNTHTHHEFIQWTCSCNFKTDHQVAAHVQFVTQCDAASYFYHLFVDWIKWTW